MKNSQGLGQYGYSLNRAYLTPNDNEHILVPVLGFPAFLFLIMYFYREAHHNCWLVSHNYGWWKITFDPCRPIVSDLPLPVK